MGEHYLPNRNSERLKLTNKMKSKAIILIIISFFLHLSSTAQLVTYDHDKSKYNQWKSMENPLSPEDWNFSPDWYYYLTHKNYSGASMKWQWRGFKSGWVITFDENKSNIKRAMIERIAHIVSAEETRSKTQSELDTITPIYKEEMIRTAERNIDAMYAQYENDFKKMQNAITVSLSYCLNRSNGKLYEAVVEIQRENDLVLANIEYVHKTGIGYEMENAKRQIAYEEAIKKMQHLANACKNLVFYAKCYYKNNSGNDDLVHIIE